MSIHEKKKILKRKRDQNFVREKQGEKQEKTRKRQEKQEEKQGEKQGEEQEEEMTKNRKSRADHSYPDEIVLPPSESARAPPVLVMKLDNKLWS